jgi:hypothetical protein
MLLICPAFTPPRSFQLNRLLKMAVTARQPSSIDCLCPPLLHRTVAYWTLRVTVAAWLVEPAEAVDGHGAGSAGCVIPRGGATATEQMKKHRHDAENLQTSHGVPPSPATAE